MPPPAPCRSADARVACAGRVGLAAMQGLPTRQDARRRGSQPAARTAARPSLAPRASAVPCFAAQTSSFGILQTPPSAFRLRTLSSKSSCWPVSRRKWHPGDSRSRQCQFVGHGWASGPCCRRRQRRNTRGCQLAGAQAVARADDRQAGRQLQGSRLQDRAAGSPPCPPPKLPATAARAPRRARGEAPIAAAAAAVPARGAGQRGPPSRGGRAGGGAPMRWRHWWKGCRRLGRAGPRYTPHMCAAGASARTARRWAEGTVFCYYFWVVCV